MNYRFFVSYSHNDRLFVEAITDLLKITGITVFRDKENIPLGTPWRQFVEDALKAADTAIVFWSGHSAESPEVQNEYKRAISLRKKVVPVMLDNTPLPADLAEYNGLDLKPFFQSAEAKMKSGTRQRSATDFKLQFALMGLKEVLPQLHEASTEIFLTGSFDQD